MLSIIWKYVDNWLVLWDQAINTLRGGDPGETLSCAAAKAEEKNHLWGCILCRLLGLFWKNHCQNALNRVYGDRSLWGD